MNRDGSRAGGTAQQAYFMDAIQPVGTIVEIRPNAPWQVATLEVDNPSGRWLYVQPLGDYIAPYTIGVKRELRPTTIDIKIEFAEPPAGGGVNVDDGTQIAITLHDTWIGEDTGLTYKIATDTDKIIQAIRSQRRGWGDLALTEDIHIQGVAGSTILADTGTDVYVSYATVSTDLTIWVGGGLQGILAFSLQFANPSQPPIRAMLAYPDQLMTEFLFPPRFYGSGDLVSSVDDGGVPTPIQNQWTIDVWYREVIP